MTERSFDDQPTRLNRPSFGGEFDYSSLESTCERTPPAPGVGFFDSFDPQYEQIAQISLDFEKRWTPNRDFSIEEALERVDESARETLFARLLEIDVARGFERRAALGVADYERRFPKWTKIVQKVCADLANQTVVVNSGRVGRIVENFQIQKILGRGGMGVVYKAFDYQLKREVALKYLLPRLNGAETGVDDFMNEIKLQARLHSPRVVCAYSVHKDGAYIFLAMEYVDGTDLARYYNGGNEFRAASGPLPFLEAARIISQVAAALSDVHREKIIHRDVKPSNIMIERDGNVRLLDLGVGVYEKNAFHSRANWSSATDRADLTRDYLSDAADSSGDYSPNDAETRTEPSSSKNRVVGTALYMSPEAFATPDDVDTRSDLYSLGGAFFFLLTGRSPVDWFDPTRQSAPAISFAEFAKRKKLPAPKPFLRVAERLLQPDREKRYRSADDARRDLEALISRYSRPFYRRWARTAVYGAALLAALFYFSFGDALKNNGTLRRASASAATDPAKTLELLATLDPNDFSSKKRAQFFALRGDARAQTARSDDEIQNAIADYSRLLESSPNDFSASTARARLNIRLERFDEARADVEKALETSSENDELKTLAAKIRVLKWRETVPLTDDEANAKKADLNEALRLAAELETAESFYWSARAYLEFNDPEFAKIELAHSLERDSRYWPSACLLGKIEFERLKGIDPASEDWPDEFQTTVDKLQNAVELVPSENDEAQADCFDKLSLCYFWNGDYEKAAARCDRVVKLRRATSDVLLRRLQANFLLVAESQTEDAPVSEERWRKLLDGFEKTLDRATLFDEDRANALVLAAKICLELGENRRCVDLINEVRKTRSSIREYYCADLILKPLELQEEAEKNLAADASETETTPKPEETAETETTPKPEETTENARPDASSLSRDEAERLFQSLNETETTAKPEETSETESTEIVRPDASSLSRDEAERLFQSLIDASKPQPNDSEETPKPDASSDENSEETSNENASDSGPLSVIE